MKTYKYPNRAERTKRALSKGWCSSMDIIQRVGTVTPSKCLHEVRKSGVALKVRRVDGVIEYRLA